MLKYQKLFQNLEDDLTKRGKIAEFERKFGPIKGRMMICETNVPANLDIKIPVDQLNDAVAFGATFDFYAMEVGLVINVKTLEPLSSLWLTPQTDDAVEPDEVWVKFFIEKLMLALNDPDAPDGYGVPIYSFVNDTNDMTITPCSPKAD